MVNISPYFFNINSYTPCTVTLLIYINQDFDSCWRNTSSFKTINTFITMNHEGLKNDILKRMDEKRIAVHTNL